LIRGVIGLECYLNSVYKFFETEFLYLIKKCNEYNFIKNGAIRWVKLDRIKNKCYYIFIMITKK